MAAGTHTLNLGDDELLPAWKSVIELSGAMETSELTIIGGLMVYLHASRGGVAMPRSTDDADFLVDALVNNAGLIAFAAAARTLDFELKVNGRHAYRFVHADGRKLDVMVPDHLPERIRPRLSRLPALEAAAGQQAIDRRDLYELGFSSGRRVVIGVPDELGALVAKGAAFLIDQRDPERHVQDAATILASITDASVLDYGRSTRSDRQRLRVLGTQLSDSASRHWVGLQPDDRSRGLLNLALVLRAMRAD
ncbi:hypothetical protein ACFVU2_03480 [Leifsonia sp. NPDC058194]|uniref:hypothetical protein n=1 Tax=Leifsonia sp. NPDC058194 TaxID=3346374 RepID=UPI0036DAAE16